MAYAWPGNVRQLENVVERALAFSHGPAADRRRGPRAGDRRQRRQRRSSDGPWLPDEGLDFETLHRRPRAGADPAVARAHARQQAPGGEAAEPEAHDAHREAETSRARGRRRLRSSPEGRHNHATAPRLLDDHPRREADRVPRPHAGGAAADVQAAGGAARRHPDEVVRARPAVGLARGGARGRHRAARSGRRAARTDLAARRRARGSARALQHPARRKAPAVCRKAAPRAAGPCERPARPAIKDGRRRTRGRGAEREDPLPTGPRGDRAEPRPERRPAGSRTQGSAAAWHGARQGPSSPGQRPAFGPRPSGSRRPPGRRASPGWRPAGPRRTRDPGRVPCRPRPRGAGPATAASQGPASNRARGRSGHRPPGPRLGDRATGHPAPRVPDRSRSGNRPSGTRAHGRSPARSRPTAVRAASEHRPAGVATASGRRAAKGGRPSGPRGPRVIAAVGPSTGALVGTGPGPAKRRGRPAGPPAARPL